MMLSQLSPLIFALSVAQWWKQMPPSAKTAVLRSAISNEIGRASAMIHHSMIAEARPLKQISLVALEVDDGFAVEGLRE